MTLADAISIIGVKVVADRLGFKPPRIYKWKTRNKVPAAQSKKFRKLCAEHGIEARDKWMGLE